MPEPADRRILVVGAGLPGIGEGSTVASTLVAALRERGCEASLALLNEEQDRDYLSFLFAGDERAGTPVESDECVWIRESGDPDRDLARRIAELRPEVVLAVGMRAAARALSRPRGAALVVWASAVLEEKRPRRGLRGRRPRGIVDGALRSPGVSGAWPRRVIESAALVFAPTPETREILCRLYPRQAGKVHPRPLVPDWLSREVAGHSTLPRSTERRDLDVVFVAARWDERSAELRAIAEIGRRLPELRIGLVGEVAAPPAGMRSYGLVVDRLRYLSILGEARVMACATQAFTSFCAPLAEAAAMGCRLVATPCCGNRVLESHLRTAESPQPRHLSSAIRESLSGSPQPSEPPPADGLDELVRVLEVV